MKLPQALAQAEQMSNSPSQALSEGTQENNNDTQDQGTDPSGLRADQRSDLHLGDVTGAHPLNRQAPFRRDANMVLPPGTLIAEFCIGSDALDFCHSKGMKDYCVTPGINQTYAVRVRIPESEAAIPSHGPAATRPVSESSGSGGFSIVAFTDKGKAALETLVRRLPHTGSDL